MSSTKCPQCGLTNWASSESCKRCKLDFRVGQSGQSFDSGNRNEFSHNESQYIPSDQRFNQQQNLYTQPQQKQGLAIASMVIGIVGFVGGCFGGFVLAPFGLVLGIVSLVKAKKHPHIHGGKGFAIAGVILSGLLILTFPIIAAIAIPNLIASRKSANEAAAINTLKTLSGAQATYMTTANGGQCGDLVQLQQNNLISPVLASGQKSGYQFRIIKTPSSTASGSLNCEVTAIPLVESNSRNSFSATGTRSFFISNEDRWIIHVSNIPGIAANITDASIEEASMTIPENGSYPPRISTNPKVPTNKY
jgi:type IV pilus assembly protein PilA